MKTMIGGSYIEVGRYVFRACNSVTVRSSWKTLGDTCTIQLPNIKELLSKGENIKGGDAVLVKLGYDTEVEEEFRGYVTTVGTSQPYTIECMDEMYQLNRTTVTKAWDTTTLKEVVQYLVGDATVGDIPDISLDNFRLNRVSKGQALQKLKDEYGLVAYFRSGQLYVGLAYYEAGLGVQRYRFEAPDANAPAPSGLNYVRASDMRIKLTMVSLMPDNSKVTVEAGDADGEARTLHYFNKSAAELKALATDAINRLKYDGYRGSFLAKGLPRVTHGMVAELSSGAFPERDGRYFIDAVNTTFNGRTGYSREIELGRTAGATDIQAQEA